LRGEKPEDLMIVEYCDTSRAGGVFRKYSAFKVGAAIIPCHAFVSSQWCLKAAQNEPTESTLRDEMAFVEGNPHEGWLRKVFAIAGIDYGRVDYGVLDGVPQVWEINLNPIIGSGTGRQKHPQMRPELRSLRESGRNAFHGRLMAAFVALDERGIGRDMSATVAAPILVRLQAEAARRERRQAVLNGLYRLYRHRSLGLLIRTAYARLFPPPRP
ncbi:MAG: hypothetical protein ACRD26_14535, partial [Vicinamibacterales bacterium]